MGRRKIEVPTDKDVMLMYRLTNGQRTTEISKELQVNESAVNMALHRIRQRVGAKTNVQAAMLMFSGGRAYND